MPDRRLPAIPTRRVAASAAFLVTVLALSMLLPAISGPLDREWATPLGTLPVGDLLAIGLAAFLAALLDRGRFRYWALALAAVVWALRLVALLIVAPSMAETNARELATAHLLALPTGMLVAWACAIAGERFEAGRAAERAQVRAAARPRAKWR